jgi:galactokinase
VLSGSGLSSSAAMEVLLCAMQDAMYNGFQMDPVLRAEISQYAENEYFGKPCGLMDQMACSVGGIVAIDFKCAEPKIEPMTVSFSDMGYAMVVVNSRGSHDDLTDEYASIREEMTAVASYFGEDVLRQVQKEQARPEKQLQPAARELKYDDPASAAAEEGLIRLLYLEPALISTPGLPPPEGFSAPGLGRIYAVLRKRIEKGQNVSTDHLAGELSGDELGLLVSILQKPEMLSRSRQSMSDYIAKIEERKQLRDGGTDLMALRDQLKKKKGYEG